MEKHKALENSVARIRRLMEIQAPSADLLRDIEGELEVISSNADPEVVRLLSPLLRDNDAEHFYVHWSMVHIMEDIAMDPYAMELLHCLPALQGSAPEWASVLVVRVMNAPLGALAFMKALPSCEVAQMDALRAVLVAWSEGDPEMAKKFAGTVEMIDYVKGRK